MAPEVGLEPTTSRLTAARSTIELLWNPKGNDFTSRCTARQTDSSRRLAARAIKCAPRGLPDALDQAAAIRTRPPGTVINPQPLLVIIRGARRPAKIKQSVRPTPAKIQRHGAAAFDGFGQNLANRPPKPRDL